MAPCCAALRPLSTLNTEQRVVREFERHLCAGSVFHLIDKKLGSTKNDAMRAQNCSSWNMDFYRNYGGITSIYEDRAHKYSKWRKGRMGSLSTRKERKFTMCVSSHHFVLPHCFNHVGPYGFFPATTAAGQVGVFILARV